MIQTEASPQLEVTSQLTQMRQFFQTGKTRDLAFRREQLTRLKAAIRAHQDQILNALHRDLGKPTIEAYLAEIGVIKEIDYTLKHLNRWAAPNSVYTSPELFPATAQVVPEPLGVVLIISPWNYPFQLAIWPLISAIAAGNCAIVKPSELTPATSQVIATLIQQTFDPAYIHVVEGGVEASQALLEQQFDHIFFTGGSAIGRIVMTAAAKHLTPVTLELGGKSPCIVDADIDLKVTAKRIVWGKFFNAGQTCVAPDYLLVDWRVKPALLEAIATTIREMYGDDPAQSPDYGRIVSDRHFQRLVSLLPSGKVVVGGQSDAAQRYIAPTVVDQVSVDSPLMQEEIFGPILPVLEYETVEEAIALINSRPKPLALYLFSNNSQLHQQIQQSTSSGGFCINETVMQAAQNNLPFGGVGESGMGRYHGKAGFETFSHYKSVLKRPFWLDLPLRYPPYGGKLKLIKRIVGF